MVRVRLRAEERWRELEQRGVLRVLSEMVDHIDDMDQMRQGIGLHAYAQRDPLTEYKFAAYDMFEEMEQSYSEVQLKILYRVRTRQK